MPHILRPAAYLIALLAAAAVVEIFPGGPARVLPAGALATLCIVLIWYRWKRPIEIAAMRRAKGLCVTCGYDLTANVSGVCPECGRGVAP